LPQGACLNPLAVFSRLSQLEAALTKSWKSSWELKAPDVSQGICCVKHSIVECNTSSSVSKTEPFLLVNLRCFLRFTANILT
jgi:hypothetical protein